MPTEGSIMELIFMGVPRHLAQTVADLIAEDGARSGTPLLNGWTDETLRRAWRESKENIRKLLEYLATHPDEEFGTPELATAIGVPDWNSIAGMLGPFTRRFKNHYGVVLPPWNQRTDANDRDHLTMPAAVANVIRIEAGM
jgi:hypothetical protein